MLSEVRPQIPAETARVAHNVFNSENLYLRIGNHLVELTAGLECEFAHLKSDLIQSPPLLTLIAIFQYTDRLTDSQAADALRRRVDWQYALHLPLNFPGVPHLQNCEFRELLRTEPQCLAAFQQLPDRLGARGWLRQDNGAALQLREVLDTVCSLNRLEKMILTLKGAFAYLATHHPEWLRQHTRPHWYQRYYRQHFQWSLPTSQDARQDLFEAIGRDGLHLLQALNAESCLPESEVLRHAAPIQALVEEWRQQYDLHADGAHFRSAACSKCNGARS